MAKIKHNGEWLELGSLPEAFSRSFTLAAASWSEGSQTVDVEDITSESLLTVAPAPESTPDYAAAGVLCVAQGGGTLTFTCEDVPENDISVNVIVFGLGKGPRGEKGEQGDPGADGAIHYTAGEGIEIDENNVISAHGLPDASDLEDGTAMVAVGGEWKMQEGYGYESKPFETIEWDGDISGITATVELWGNTYYKASDVVITKTQAENSVITENDRGEMVERTIKESENSLNEAVGGCIFSDNYICFFSGQAGTYHIWGDDIVLPESGTYFAQNDDQFGFYCVAKWESMNNTVHKIDSKYIPNDSSKLDADSVSHETWTFTLNDGTTVTKEIVTWTGQA